jgi:hypothetical protein
VHYAGQNREDIRDGRQPEQIADDDPAIERLH